MSTTARLRNARPRTRLALAVVAAFVVFAGDRGFAASLGMNADRLAAGNQVVASCGSGLTFAYETTFDDAVARYAVNGIKLSNIPLGCLNKSLSATFEDTGNDAVGAEVSVTLPASGTTESIAVDPSSNMIDATRLSSVSVVVS